MALTFTDQQKRVMLESVPNEKVYTVSRYDIQIESIERCGRLLNDTELETAEKLLNWGIGENMNFIYDTIFAEMKND